MAPSLPAFVVAFLGGFLGAFASTESVRRFALRIGAVDHPGGRRVHRSPTARLGGLGIALGLAFGLTIALGLEHVVFNERKFAGLIAASVVALAVGVVDDLRGLGAGSKLAGQVVAALLLWHAGWRIDSLGLPGVGELPIAPFGLPLTVLWVVGVINAWNLIDGLDGLAGGLALVGALAAACLCVAAGDPAWALAVAVAGAAAGFLWFNAPPALIFMGDAGSHLLGVVLAALGLRLAAVGPEGTLPFVPMLLLAVPLADMLWAIVRRGRASATDDDAGRGRTRARLARIARADDAHVHHRLLAAGWTPASAVRLLWRVAAAFAVLGVTLAFAPLLALALSAIVAGWLGRVASRVTGRDVVTARAAAPPGALAPLAGVVRRPVAAKSPASIEAEEIAA